MRSTPTTWCALILAVVSAACGGGEPPARADGEATSASPATAFDPEPWLERGQEIQRSTFATLSAELSGALRSGGVAAALEYCNVAAYPVTDSLSSVYDVTIRRATLRPRNPGNRASQAEAVVLAEYEERLVRGEEPAPVVHALDEGTVAYYAPIRIQGQCLQCHGTVGVDVSEESAALLADLYPDDEALGYSEGDLRGLWSLTFHR